ncbi:MAG: cyclic-phosphate processing receiver domain-containing protein [Bacteroidota bacterium]
MNIWLDDQRKAPDDWLHLKNIEDVERLINSSQGLNDFCIDTMSFDFHLDHAKKGIDVMKYLAGLCVRNKTRKYWPKTVLYHSNDPEGIKIMKDFAESFECLEL